LPAGVSVLGASALTPLRVSLTTLVIAERPSRESVEAATTDGPTRPSASITLSKALTAKPPDCR
jgi:hypothetical protein